MNKTSPRKVYGCNFTVIKLLKTSDKRKSEKQPKKKKHITYKGIKIRMTADFSLERIQLRRQWYNCL